MPLDEYLDALGERSSRGEEATVSVRGEARSSGARRGERRPAGMQSASSRLGIGFAG